MSDPNGKRNHQNREHADETSDSFDFAQVFGFCLCAGMIAMIAVMFFFAYASATSETQYTWEAFKYDMSHPLTDGNQAKSDYIAQVHKQNEAQTYTTVDIDDLLDAYDANVNMAVRKYEGKFVKITYAHVSDIGTDSISFEGDGDTMLAYVVSKHINKHDRQVLSDIYKVETGDFVTVYGKIDGRYDGGTLQVSILIDHIVPTTYTPEQLIQRASNRTMDKMKKMKK